MSMELYKKNLVTIARYVQLQRDQARLQGERGQLIADIARSRGKIAETELQILQLDQDFRTDVLKDLRETQAKIAELQERAECGRGRTQAHRYPRAARRELSINCRCTRSAA